MPLKLERMPKFAYYFLLFNMIGFFCFFHEDSALFGARRLVLVSMDVHKKY